MMVTFLSSAGSKSEMTCSSQPTILWVLLPECLFSFGCFFCLSCLYHMCNWIYFSLFHRRQELVWLQQSEDQQLQWIPATFISPSQNLTAVIPCRGTNKERKGGTKRDILHHVLHLCVCAKFRALMQPGNVMDFWEQTLLLVWVIFSCRNEKRFIRFYTWYRFL